MYGGDSNFAVSTSNAVSLVINAAPGFDFEVSPGSLTVAKGAPGKATVVISPLNGFTGQVQFSCSNLPTGVACNFTPGSVTISGAAANSMLSITLDATNNSRHGNKPIDAILGGVNGDAGPGDGKSRPGLSTERLQC